MEIGKSEQTAFEIERDRRLQIISEKSLWTLLRDRVRINGKAIAQRTARDVFSIDSFEYLTGVKLRIWLASAEVIEEYNRELQIYGTDTKKVESSTTD